MDFFFLIILELLLFYFSALFLSFVYSKLIIKDFHKNPIFMISSCKDKRAILHFRYSSEFGFRSSVFVSLKPDTSDYLFIPCYGDHFICRFVYKFSFDPFGLFLGKTIFISDFISFVDSPEEV